VKYTILVFEADGSPATPVSIIRGNDPQALAAAGLMIEAGQSAEIRDGGRLVGRVDAGPPGETPPE
jgi:hypothetical protein